MLAHIEAWAESSSLWFGSYPPVKNETMKGNGSDLSLFSIFFQDTN